jgi:hypothetical protein
MPDQHAYAVDSLSLLWEGFWGYAFPPTALIPRVIQKMKCHVCHILLIAPCWPSQSWFPDMLELLVDLPRRLPVRPNLAQSRAASPQRAGTSSPSRVELVQRAVASRGFSLDVADRIAQPQRKSTLAIYQSKWSRFTAWCKPRQIDPLRATIPQIKVKVKVGVYGLIST